MRTKRMAAMVCCFLLAVTGTALGSETWSIATFEVSKQCGSGSDPYGQALVILKGSGNENPSSNIITTATLTGPEGVIVAEFGFEPENKILGRYLPGNSQWEYDPVLFKSQWRGFFDDRRVVTGSYKLGLVLTNGQKLSKTCSVTNVSDPCAARQALMERSELFFDPDMQALDILETAADDPPTPRVMKFKVLSELKTKKGLTVTWTQPGKLQEFFRLRTETTSACIADIHNSGGKKIGLLYVWVPSLVRGRSLPQSLINDIKGLGGKTLNISIEVKNTKTGEKTRSPVKVVKLQ